MTPVVIAHGLVGRADLPIPAELFGAAAAAVLAASFAALAAGWTRPRLQEPRERPRFRVPLIVDVVAGLLGVLVFAACVYAGLAGTGVPTENLAPTVIYVLTWVGMPVLSLLLGDVFRLLSPWRAVGRAAGSVLQRFGGAGDTLPYPERLGRWPAVIGIVLFGAVELCWGRGDDPQVLATLALVYFACQLVGMSLYGVEAWSRNGDALGVYFGLFARLSPFTRRDGRLYTRPLLTGAPGLDERPRGTPALVVVAIAVTVFDGAREGPLFGSVAPDIQEFFTDLGATKATGLELAFVIGLLVAISAVALVYRLGVEGMARVRPAAPDLRRRFAHTLVPIAAAYVVAHYFSLLVYQGQALWFLASDPLGDGSDLFGTAGQAIDYSVISTTAIWYVQVVALVVGHVAGLVLAHDRALALWSDVRAATRSQLWMLGVMVAFTCLGLWQLSVANV